MLTRLAIAMALCVLAGGCASLEPNQASMTFKTEPPGAMLYYEGNTSWGIAPQTRIYTGDPRKGKIPTGTVTAVWPSGAKQTYRTELPMHGYFEATISRPADAPGLDKDLAWVATLRQAKAAEDAANSIPTSTNCIKIGNGFMNCTSY